MTTYAGIDYGSKMAGTTVIAYPVNGSIQFTASQKKKSADQFILSWVAECRPKQIFIDAPLSLPGVYRKMEGYEDYFYRQADRSLNAMSPMFLGGLTARAMQLAKQLEACTCKVHEVYPGHLAKILELSRFQYKKDRAQIPVITALLLKHLPFHCAATTLPDWHHVDALLALLSAYRFQQGNHNTFGNKPEGIIIV